MAFGPIHCGSFLLLAAAVLLIVSSISAPVINKISFLDVKNGAAESTFGAFGYCANINSGNGGCSSSKLGYNIATVAGQTSSLKYVNTDLDTLTKALILHPIVAGIAFLAFLVALCSDHLGFILASLIAFVAFIASLAALVIDFILFGIIKHEINSKTSAKASFSTAIWLTLAGTIVLLFASFIVFFECCSGNRRRSRADRDGRYNQKGYVGNQAGTGYGKKRWWSRNRGVNTY
ncbi:MAG: hypothetical protein TREMPRED_005484 [Tremellales sp. Tagirdzhanova-0007]|nr:MAG: hypothetical protein TREMPRED_005484 [Tremellales sp. Tagirdzhanova-0007]